jgi:putative SOS response-associated peptidase YedK
VPADGFFEWKKESHGKVPYRATLKTGELFAFAGLWDAWRDEHGNEIKTFTILTTAANALLTPLHDRMPVILKKTDETAWLDPSLSDVMQIDALIRSYPAEEMELFPVSSVVNSWKNDTPECLQRL